MLNVFGSVKDLLKLDEVSIDNIIFKMHYKATVVILIALSLMVTSTQFFGDPIDCIVDDLPAHIMEIYCWISSTFTIPNRINGEINKTIAHPGVSGYVKGKDEVKYYKYYQWVCFCLFFQAMLFHVPRYLWKKWEGGRIKSLVLDLNCPMVSESCKTERLGLLVDFFRANLHKQNFYAYRFFFCEILNFLNVLGQIYLMDVFFDGEFTTHGIDVLRFSEMEPEYRTDPMAKVFPKVTKCTFFTFGPSDSIQEVDILCILPLNIVNEKIYVFLWFWFIALTILSGLSLIYRLVVVALPSLRLFLLRARSRFSRQKEIEAISRKLQIGDWFILYQVRKNMDPLIYKDLVSELATRFEE